MDSEKLNSLTAALPLQALRAFVEVGQRGSIKAAAQALHVTSGAVSQQIRLLEDRVGMALFTRERQGLRLTEAGASVHPALLQAFAQMAQAMQSLQQTQARPTPPANTPSASAMTGGCE